MAMIMPRPTAAPAARKRAARALPPPVTHPPPRPAEVVEAEAIRAAAADLACELRAIAARVRQCQTPARR